MPENLESTHVTDGMIPERFIKKTIVKLCLKT